MSITGRRPIFWCHLVVGWLVTTMFLGVLVAVFGSEEMTDVEGWTVLVAVQLLSVAAAYPYAMRHATPRVPPPGFDVVPKPEANADAR